MTSLLCMLMLFLSPVHASDLGVYGHVYPIAEDDFLTFIHQRLEHMQAQGRLQAMKTRFIDRVKAHVLRPTPVRGLSTTTHPKTFYRDPTYVLQRNIRDERGHVLFQKGRKINPLNTVHLHEVLFFLNADDPKQVAWARHLCKQFSLVKTILVKGNIKKATQALHVRVYFDQYGRISKKLGLEHIPCLVKQVGKRFQVQEFSVDE